MEQGWNFQGHVALPLETIGRREGVFYSSDEVAIGHFVDAMEKILNICCIEHDAFSSKCAKFAGKSATKIGDEMAKELFDEFRDLYNNWRDNQ